MAVISMIMLLGHESINTTQAYLKGITDENLINSAIETSPLMNMKK